ncbi:MAG: ferric reductase-like transmembrane domain-containing protein [Lacisediminihabitans sp.]
MMTKVASRRGDGLRRAEQRDRYLSRVVYPRRMRLADSLEAIVWLTIALVLALFLADSGLADFATPAGTFTGIGIVCGLVGTNLLLIQLVLASRLPAIDRAFGHDHALLTHEHMSKPVFYLIFGHVLFLWVGYALTTHVNVVAEIGVMFSTLPDMKIAYLGFGLLAAVVVTSVVIVRRKLAYEFWHAVHFLAYAAVLAALPHQFSTGQLFADGTWARYYWLLLYAVVAGALLVYRFGIPVIRTLRHDVRVSGVRAVAPGVYSIQMTGRGLEVLGARGGQFFIWRFWAPGQWWHAHPFSLSAAPESTRLQVTIRELGSGTRKLSSLPIGTRVSIEGPYGLFTERARTTRRAVAIAAGIGITPIISLLEHGDFAPGEMTVIVRATDEEGLYLYPELYELCARKSAGLYVFTGNRSQSGRESWLPATEMRRNVTLSTIVPEIAHADVFICGPRHWTDLVVEDARRARVPKFRIHYERFSW